MRKEKLFHLLVLLGFTLLSMTISAQTDSRDVYGWLRYDDYNQDEYGICKFKTDAAGYGRAGREIQENADDNQNRYQREQYFVNGPPPVGDLRTAVS